MLQLSYMTDIVIFILKALCAIKNSAQYQGSCKILSNSHFLSSSPNESSVMLTSFLFSCFNEVNKCSSDYLYSWKNLDPPNGLIHFGN